jgi:hypothetical protein
MKFRSTKILKNLKQILITFSSKSIAYFRSIIKLILILFTHSSNHKFIHPKKTTFNAKIARPKPIKDSNSISF